MKLKILSFSGENFVHDEVTSVTVMTKSGEITLLDKHAPMIASIEPCVLYTKYRDENNMEQREDFAVGSGVVEVNGSSVKVMADIYGKVYRSRGYAPQIYSATQALWSQKIIKKYSPYKLESIFFMKKICKIVNTIYSI